MNLTFHPHAEKELEEVENYYNSISSALGDQFSAEIESAIARILKFPISWQSLSKRVRRRRLTPFPYGLVYRVKVGEIRILAVMHLHRDPNYWIDRSNQ